MFIGVVGNKGKKLIINLDKVLAIEETEETGSTVFFVDGSRVTLDNAIEDVRKIMEGEFVDE